MGTQSKPPLLVTVVLVQAFAGLVCELLAAWQDWWRFSPWTGVMVQIVLFWGVIMGLLTKVVFERPALIRFAAGAGLGGAAELLNYVLLHNWSFPENRIWTAALPWPGLGLLALTWGLLPLLVPVTLARFGAGGQGEGA